MHSRCILWGWGHGLWLSMDMGGQWDILLLLVISIGGPTTTVSQPTLRKHVEIVTANQFWTQNRCWLHGNWLLATSGYPCNCTRITAQQHSWHTRTNACQLVHNILSRELCYLRLWHWIKFYAKVNQLAHSLSSTTLIIRRGIVIHGGIGDSRQARILSRLTKWTNKDWKERGKGDREWLTGGKLVSEVAIRLGSGIFCCVPSFRACLFFTWRSYLVKQVLSSSLICSKLSEINMNLKHYSCVYKHMNHIHIPSTISSVTLPMSAVALSCMALNVVWSSVINWRSSDTSLPGSFSTNSSFITSRFLSSREDDSTATEDTHVDTPTSWLRPALREALPPAQAS